MADRRMFAKTIVLSDAFLDMPHSARSLYVTLGMLADDDGFINFPKSIMRQCGASEDDLKVLLAKKFLIAFESGVIAIKHWRVNNYLRGDRYKPTIYADEKNMLTIDERGIYHSDFGIPSIGIPSMGIPSLGKDSKGEVSLGKDSKGGVGGTRTGSSKRVSKEEKNLEMLQTIGSGYGFDDFVYEKLTEWMKYKGEIGFVYKEQGAKSFFTQTKKSVERFGADAVVSAIDTAIASGWKGFYPEKTKQTVSGGIDWSRV